MVEEGEEEENSHLVKCVGTQKQARERGATRFSFLTPYFIIQTFSLPLTQVNQCRCRWFPLGLTAKKGSSAPPLSSLS